MTKRLFGHGVQRIERVQNENTCADPEALGGARVYLGLPLPHRWISFSLCSLSRSPPLASK